MDPLTLAASVVAATGIGAGWRSRRRAYRAESEAAHLRSELRGERHAASHDPLTGLPNRRGFHRIGAELVADAGRHPLVAVVVDLDDFKRVNDEHGHATGDEVLVMMARRFATYAGDNLIARLGGDEFAGLLGCPADERWLIATAHALTLTLGVPTRTSRGTLAVTASVGVAPVLGPTGLVDAVRRADAAMYQAKSDRIALDRTRPPHLPYHPVVPHPQTASPRQLVDTTPGAETGGP
jgi:diguanylate cyclase (GGDEF)-like protein